jgi:hypothetical protein
LLASFARVALSSVYLWLALAFIRRAVKLARAMRAWHVFIGHACSPLSTHGKIEPLKRPRLIQYTSVLESAGGASIVQLFCAYHFLECYFKAFQFIFSSLEIASSNFATLSTGGAMNAFSLLTVVNSFATNISPTI